MPNLDKDAQVERERIWITLLRSKGSLDPIYSHIDVFNVLKNTSTLAADAIFIDSVSIKDETMLTAYANTQNKRELDLLYSQRISWGPYHSTEEYRVNALNKQALDKQEEEIP